MALIDICSDAADELGIDAPSSITDNADDPDARLLLRMAKKEGFLLSRRAFWQVMRREYTFTTDANEQQPQATLPSDFDIIIPETVFNRTRRRAMYGAISPQEWAEVQAGIVTALDPSFMLRGNRFYITPAPETGETVAFEYMSRYWAIPADGSEATQTTWEEDSDTCVFPEEIVTQGVIWRWRAHKGLEFESIRLDYERMVGDQIMRDGAKPRLNAGHTRGDPTSRSIGKASIRDFNTIG